jgi:hypothetical protein
MCNKKFNNKINKINKKINKIIKLLEKIENPSVVSSVWIGNSPSVWDIEYTPQCCCGIMGYTYCPVHGGIICNTQNSETISGQESWELNG